VKPLILLTLCCACSFAQNERGTILLQGLESVEGLQTKWGTSSHDIVLEPNRDARFISEGRGSLHLQAVSGDREESHYLSVIIPVEPRNIEQRLLRLDCWTSTPEDTQALYVRLRNSEGQIIGSWASWGGVLRSGRKTTIELQRGLSIGGLAWEEKVIEAKSWENLAQIEVIIGTRPPGRRYDIYVDNIRLSKEQYKAFADYQEPKRLFRSTVLARDGKPEAVIVRPTDGSYDEATRLLREGLRQATGLDFPVRPAPQPPIKTPPDQNLVLLGNVSNNGYVLPLYMHYYMFSDARHPGPDGHEARTILDPWGNGRNVIALGGSDVEGVEQAIQVFLKRLPPRAEVIAVEPFTDIVSGEGPPPKPPEDLVDKELKGAHRRIDIGSHGGLAPQIVSLGFRYGQTGYEAYAEAFKRVMYLWYENYLSGPKTYGGPWGMDADFQLYRLIPAWDLVEESKAFSDEDRMKITRILAEFTQYCSRKAAGVVGNERVRFNHQTFPALGLMYAGMYFRKYYPECIEWRRWLGIADACFTMQSRSFKANEDCNGYQWLTLGHTMRYCLARPDFTYFENGNARRDADYAILCMDNLGYQVTYGDVGGFVGWWSELPFLGGAEWYYKDGRYQWARELKMKVSGRDSQYELAVADAPKEPTDLLGARAFPLDSYYWKTFGGPKAVPLEDAVDKVVMRRSFDPRSEYLLLDGLSNGGHRHFDGNSISRITWNERIWLCDTDYIKSLPKFHNGVLIFRDGQSQTIPDFCELERAADFPHTGFSETTLRDYAGVDWHRNIMWSKGRYFLVIDELDAKQPGDYSFRTIWQTLGDVQLSEDGLAVEQKGERFHFGTTPEYRLRLTDDEETGRKNWGAYKFAEPIIRVFQQIWDGRLAADQDAKLVTLMYSPQAEAHPGWTVKRVGAGAFAVLEDEQTVALAGVGDPGKPQQYGPWTIAAAQFHITPECISLVDATRLGCLDTGLNLQFEQPRTVEFDLTQATSAASNREHCLVPRGDEPKAGTPPSLAADRAKLAAALNAVVASAPAPAKPPTAGALPSDLPQLVKAWSYREKLEAYLLTNNRGYFEAYDTGVSVTCDPAPLKQNVFRREADGTNRIENILDGGLRSTDTCTMWDTDQPVTITLDFQDEYDFSRLDLLEWFATSSSKDKLYQLARLTVEASNDNFAADTRRVLEYNDTEMHGNWGEPGHAPHRYSFPDLKVRGRQLRLHLTPRPGTGIYVAELEVWGNKEGGLEISPDEQRRRGVPIHTFRALAAADLDGDGQDELIAGSTNKKVYVFDHTGKTLWTYEAEDAVTSVAAVALGGPGHPAVIAGSLDTNVYALSPEGELLWKFTPPYYKRTPKIQTVFGADLTGDGKQAVIAGADSWHYFAIDAQGHEIWRYESVHGSTAGCAGDLDGDGKDEVICGTEYYWWPCVNPDGTRRFAYSSRTGPRANAAAVADLNGDGKREVIFGGADTNVTALTDEGKLLFRYNTGDEVRALAVADLDGDGAEEVLAASQSFNVYALKGDGSLLWRRDLGEEARCVIAADVNNDGKPEVIVGDASGKLFVLRGADGRPLCGLGTGAAVLELSLLTGGADPLLAAATADGNLWALRIPK